MYQISHRIGTNLDKATLRSTFTTVEGLSSWWTEQVTGDTHLGGILTFEFTNQSASFQVMCNTNLHVSWQCIEGPSEWIDTVIDFQLETEPDNPTVLYFQHRNWRDDSKFKAHCSMKWATFLLSLKDYAEKGEGRPYPHDVHIDCR